MTFYDASVPSTTDMSPLAYVVETPTTIELSQKMKVFLENLTAERTKESYFFSLTNYFIPFMGIHPELNWREMEKKDLWSYRDYLTNKKKKRNLSANTLNMAISALRSFLAYYESRGECKNCFAEIRRHYMYKIPKRHPRYLEEEDVEKLLKALPEMPPKYRVIFYLMLYGGLRVSETLDVKKKDISIVSEVMQIRVKGKGDKERTTFIMSNEARKEIEDYLTKLKDSSPVFRGSNGNNAKYRRSHPQKLTEELSNKAGVQFTSHCLRHTFATNLVSKGMPIQFIQKLLGHASVKTTERYAIARIPDILKMVKEII